MKKIQLMLLDVFDGEDENSEPSKLFRKFEIVSILILIVLICFHPFFKSSVVYYFIFVLLAFVFTIQFLLRIYVWNKSKYLNKTSCLRFLLLDFIGGAIPLSLCIFSNFDVHIISLISVIKIVRLFDVLPGFTFLKKAFNDKKDEIFYSLLLVAFGSFIISCIIYFIESDNPDSPFKSVLDTLIWSFSKYTNDYGDIANFAPRSPFAKFCATINGLLGVAVFAVPGALLAGAFVEQISDSKKIKEIEDKRIKITKRFEESLWEIPVLSGIKKTPSYVELNNNVAVVDRFWTFESLQAYFLFTENEILEIVRNSPNLVCRILNDSSSDKSIRHKIVELNQFPFYFTNEKYYIKPYGTLYNSSGNNALIICPNGGSESCILHFTATLAKITNSNYVSQNCKVRDIKTNNSWNFSSLIEYDELVKNNDANLIPKEFNLFMDDINNTINKNNVKNVIIIRTTRSSRQSDIHYTHGTNSKDENSFMLGSISNQQRNSSFYTSIQKNLKEFCDANEGIFFKLKKNEEFSVDTDLELKSKLNNHVFRKYNHLDINVYEIFLNRDLVCGWDHVGNTKYYSLLRILMLSIDDLNNKIC
jgi:voltage-gated potassium channel